MQEFVKGLWRAARAWLLTRAGWASQSRKNVKAVAALARQCKVQAAVLRELEATIARQADRIETDAKRHREETAAAGAAYQQLSHEYHKEVERVEVRDLEVDYLTAMVAKFQTICEKDTAIAAMYAQAAALGKTGGIRHDIRSAP